jgi:hypothetical protein
VRPSFLILLSLAAALSPAATLEQLSLEALARESTAIVQGKVQGERTIQVGPLLYTLKTVAVQKRWKGVDSPTVEVALPGGRLGDQQQRFGGAPLLEPGVDYILFLWTGPSGRTQVTGFSQGVCELRTASDGSMRVVRRPNSDVALAPNGAAAADDSLDLSLEAFSQRVNAVIAEASGP